MPSFTKEKDPNSRLDWVWDYRTNWLPASDSVVDYTVTITVVSGEEETATLVDDLVSITTDSVIVWLVGGTMGVVYDVLVHVITEEGREEDATCRFKMKQK